MPASITPRTRIRSKVTPPRTKRDVGGPRARFGPMNTTQLEIPPQEAAAATMRALVYRGPANPSWESHRRPLLQDPHDAIVRITTSTICGSDLHILKGDVPSVTEGRILGHEGIGIIDDVGAAVSAFRQ